MVCICRYSTLSENTQNINCYTADFCVALITGNEERAKEVFKEEREVDGIDEYFTRKTYIEKCEINVDFCFDNGLISDYMLSLESELDGISKDNEYILDSMYINSEFSSTAQYETLKNFFKENKDISELLNTDEYLFKKVNEILSIRERCNNAKINEENIKEEEL
jgi:hypothetical protein